MQKTKTINSFIKIVVLLKNQQKWADFTVNSPI